MCPSPPPPPPAPFFRAGAVLSEIFGHFAPLSKHPGTAPGMNDQGYNLNSIVLWKFVLSTHISDDKQSYKL